LIPQNNTMLHKHRKRPSITVYSMLSFSFYFSFQFHFHSQQTTPVLAVTNCSSERFCAAVLTEHKGTVIQSISMFKLFVLCCRFPCVRFLVIS
jgi:hypothetical protein